MHMRFLIDHHLLDVTKREIELLKYHISATAADDSHAIIVTDAYKEICHAAVCRAYLESLGEAGDFIYTTEEEHENMWVIARLMRMTGKRVFYTCGTREEILPKTGFKALD